MRLSATPARYALPPPVLGEHTDAVLSGVLSMRAEEIAALLAQRELADNTHHCPHGRPTSLLFSRQELDRQFRRT